MPLQYYLKPNAISGKNNEHNAVTIIDSKPYTIADVYDIMTREGSTITKAEALAALKK